MKRHREHLDGCTGSVAGKLATRKLQAIKALAPPYEESR
jgi:hypothetical protein